MPDIIFKKLSDKLIGIAIMVHNGVGPGLLEQVYEKGMCVELQLQNISFKKQEEYCVMYKGNDIGKYYCDLVIDNKIILELKSAPEITKNMEAQVMN